MDIKKLQRIVVDALEDVKGQDIRAFNSTGLTDLFDRVVIATGTSNRHTKALANSVRAQVKAAGGDVLSMEGEESGEWVLVDLGDAIVHIMQGPIRSYYNLEEIWGDKPVALKPAVKSRADIQPDSAEQDRDSPPVKKVTKKKTSSSRTTASHKKPVAKKPAAKKIAAKRAPAKRPAR
jgi:ribosome-associated protein